MRRPVKILLRLAAVFAGLVLVTVLTVKLVFTSQRILALLTPRLEAAVNRGIGIGDAGISIWGGIGVWLGDVTVDNKSGFSPEPLLVVHKIEFKARFWPLLAGRVELDRVLLDCPSLLIEYDEKGHSNLEDLRRPTVVAPDSARETLPDESALAAPMLVDHFLMTGGGVVISYARPERRVDVAGLSLDLRTAPGEQPGVIRFTTDLAVDSVVVTGESQRTLFHEGNPRAHAQGVFNWKLRRVRLDTMALHWFGSEVALEGDLRSEPRVTEIRLNASLSPTPLADIERQLVNAEVLKEPVDIDGTVEGDLQVATVWPLPSGTIPDWSARLSLENVRWRPPAWSDSLTVKRIAVQGESRTIAWTITGGTCPGGTFTGSGSMDRIFADNPEVTTRLVADGSIARLADAMSSQTQDDRIHVDGTFHADLNAFGTIAHWRQIRLSGPFRVDDLVATNVPGFSDTLSASLDWMFDGYDLRLRQLHWAVGHSSGDVVGTIAELVPAALSGFKSPDVPRADLNIRCLYVDVDRFLEESADTSGSRSTTKQNTTVPLGLPVFAAKGHVACDTVVYAGMVLTDVKAPLLFRENVLEFNPIRGRIYGGNMQGAVSWDIGNWREPAFAATVQADSVNADSLMSRYFGWTGGLSGQAAFSGQFAGRGRDREAILSTLMASGHATMREGRLEAAPLLARIGKKLGWKGLDRPQPIRDLVADFRIDKGRVFTDTLRLATDNARWSAVGSLGFDQTLDYLVTIDLSETPSSGLPGLFKGSRVRVALTGTTAHPRVRLDATDAGKRILKNIRLPFVTDSTNPRKGALDLLRGLLQEKP